MGWLVGREGKSAGEPSKTIDEFPDGHDFEFMFSMESYAISVYAVHDSQRKNGAMGHGSSPAMPTSAT